jgi:hypothetical protein
MINVGNIVRLRNCTARDAKLIGIVIKKECIDRLSVMWPSGYIGYFPERYIGSRDDTFIVIQ